MRITNSEPQKGVLPPSHATIREAVCAYYKISLERLSENRPNANQARQVAMFEARHFSMRRTYSDIGASFERHPHTVRAAVLRLQHELSNYQNWQIRKDLAAVEDLLLLRLVVWPRRHAP